MEYLWKYTIQAAPERTLTIDAQLEVDQILVDLCTGDKHKVFSVTKTATRPLLQTLVAGKCTDDQLVLIRRKETDPYTAEGCQPFLIVRLLSSLML